MEIEWGSKNNLEKVKRDWEKTTKEPIEVEYIKGAYLAYGSELAMLRLYKYYNGKQRMGWSPNLKTWYFELELKFT
jgi:hypothetical protein